ncbi:MAG: tRNA dimethylallyltransferase [Verrucomicrobiales bacterium]|nr:tRNA dimethylallyltransferase [Verrucomicrobiales bacterium]
MASLEPVFIAGPTAAGKSELALLLAEQIGGEIISVDSMQVYRGMDIGTAKPSAEERRRVRHHLIDVAEINEAFDAAQFARLANQAVGEIASRRRVPIFCGGTGLYFRAYTEGLGDAPSANRAIREELQKLPLETLLLELQEKDPETFDRIDRQNPRRVVRAVEVIRLTGKPFSVQRGEWASTGSGPPTNFFVIRRDTADLRARIDLRVDWMFRAGLVEETRALLETGLEKNITAMQAIGYRQVVEHLGGERTLAETIDLVKIRTRQFAKRQMTWFKRQPGAQWLDWTSGTEATELLAKLLKGL